MIDRKWIGTSSGVRHVDVEAGQLRLFALATGQDDPVYSSQEAAMAAGYPAIPAPPTFAFSLGLLTPATKGGIEDMGVNIGNVLHAEQGFEYSHPIFAGDSIVMETITTDIYEKKGGVLEFIVQETRFTNQNGVICVISRSSIVVRNQISEPKQ